MSLFATLVNVHFICPLSDACKCLDLSTYAAEYKVRPRAKPSVSIVHAVYTVSSEVRPRAKPQFSVWLSAGQCILFASRSSYNMILPISCFTAHLVLHRMKSVLLWYTQRGLETLVRQDMQISSGKGCHCPCSRAPSPHICVIFFCIIVAVDTCPFMIQLYLCHTWRHTQCCNSWKCPPALYAERARVPGEARHEISLGKGCFCLSWHVCECVRTFADEHPVIHVSILVIPTCSHFSFTHCMVLSGIYMLTLSCWHGCLIPLSLC